MADAQRYSCLPPPNMISSQLGTDARRPFFPRAAGSSAAGSSADSPVDPGRLVGRLVGGYLVGRRLRGGPVAGLGGDPVGVGGGLAHHADGVLAERQLVVDGYGGESASRTGLPAAGRARLGAVAGGRLADQPARLVVLGHDVAARGVEGELGVPGALTGAVVGHQRPATVLAPPGVPLDARRVDVAAAQPLGDRVGEQLGGAVGALAAHARALGPLGDVGALGQDRGGVAHDLLERGLGGGRDVLRRLTGPDPGLDVARTQGTFHGDLQLAESGVLAAERGPEAGVGPKGELLTRIADQDEPLLVAGQPHECEVLLLHGRPFSL